MNSHATLPIAHHLDGDLFRIYFSSRDEKNRSHGTFVDIDLKNPHKILSISNSPIASPGPLGHFDDCGVSLSCLILELNRFFYMGWHLPKTVPFENMIGSYEFVSDDKLKRNSNIPILPKCHDEPLSFGYPWVSKVGRKYHLWYDTILEWKSNSTEDYEFVLRSATSEDGIHWSKALVNVFPLDVKNGERSIARPTVLFRNGIYHMFYCRNIKGLYRLGYAQSYDAFSWTRMDDLIESFGPTGHDWESTEICYPFVFEHKEQAYMLYNGNSYGKTGFGLALIDF